MKTVSKSTILESLDAMDHAQMEKVLQYIRKVLCRDSAKEGRRNRQQAMEEIRKALHSHQVLRPQF